MKDEATCVDTLTRLRDKVGQPLPTDLVEPGLQAAAATIIGPAPEDPISPQAIRWRAIVLGTLAVGGATYGAEDFCAGPAHQNKLYPGELEEANS